MLDIGFSEILVVAVIAIIAIGPDKLPETMRSIAKFIKTIKDSINDVKSSIDRELEIEELKKQANEYKNSIDSAKNKFTYTNLDNIILDDDKKAK